MVLNPLKTNRLVFLTAFSVLLSTAGCDKTAETQTQPRPALVVQANSKTEFAMGLSGEVKPRYESAQGFRINGKIMERLVEVGATVTKGQVLARLDKADTNLAAQASQANVQAANADYELAKVELNRQRELFDRKTTPRSSLDTAEARFNAAKARLQQARAQASASGNQTRYASLTADIDGVVTDIKAEPGQVVEAGQVIARIADPSQLEVAIAVPESRMAGIVPGVPVRVRLWASREKLFQGAVREVSPSADSLTRTFQVRVAITDPDEQVRIGMTAGVLFVMARDKALMLLPLPAVSQFNNATVVWVVDKNNQVQPMPVQVDQFREDGVLISEGLQGDEQIVAVGVQALTPGQTVRPIAKETP